MPDHCKRIILYIIAALIIPSNPLYAQSSSGLFTVEGVTVDITAENSVKAQEQAFEQAQVKAFEILAQRMVADGQTKAVPVPDSLTLSTLIRDYEVTSEKLSGVRYVGTYTFRFREKAISQLFSKSGVSFTQTRSKTLLVLPIFEENGKNTIWSENNLWFQAWSRTRLSSKLVPVKVPLGDLADISDIDDANPLRYERVKLDRMLGRYGAAEAAIMIAAPRSNNSLKISIYRTDRGRAEQVHEYALMRQDDETQDQFYDRAVASGYDELQKDWKRKNAVSAAQSQAFFLRIPLRTLDQWMNTKVTLQRIPGVTDIDVISLRRVEAMVKFNFRGDERRLRDELAEKSLTLGQGLQSGGEGAPLIYDLYAEQPRNESFLLRDTPAQEMPKANNDIHTF